MKNVLKSIAKNILIPLRLTAGVAALDAVEEMDDTMKIVKSLEESGLLIKSVSKKNQNEAKEQKGAFLRMLLGSLGAISLRNLFTGKGVKAKIPRQGIIRAGEKKIRVGQNF